MNPEHADVTALREGLHEIARVAAELGGRTVEASSETGAIVAVANLHGRLKGVRLRFDAQRGHDSVSMGETITAVIQDAQRQARDEYARAIAAATPPVVEEYQRRFRRAGGQAGDAGWNSNGDSR